MILNKDKNRERSRQAPLIPKPQSVGLWATSDPESVGLYHHQRKKHKKRKK